MVNSFNSSNGFPYPPAGQGSSSSINVSNTEVPMEVDYLHFDPQKRASDAPIARSLKRAKTEGAFEISQADCDVNAPAAPFDEAVQVSIRLLVNVFGNYFANGTPYEGESLFKVLKYVKFKIEHLDDTAKNEIFGEDTGSVDSLIQLFNSAMSFEGLLKQKPITVAVARVLEHVTHELDQNKSCLIPGGWVGNPIGHAMYYEIIDHGDGKLSLYSYNRGAMRGNSYTKSKDSIVPFNLFKNIPREKILNTEFMRGIVEHLTLHTNKFSSEDVYVGLFALIHEYQVNFSVEKSRPEVEKTKKRKVKGSQGGDRDSIIDPEMMMREQVSGVCPWKSVLAVLQKHLPNERFERLRYFLKYQAMEDYISQNFEGIKYPSSEFDAFEKCLEVYAYVLQKAFSKQFLTPGLLNAKLEKIGQCRSHLQILKETTINEKCERGQKKFENRIGNFKEYPQIPLPDYVSMNVPIEAPIAPPQPSDPIEMFTNLKSDAFMGSIEDPMFGETTTETLELFSQSMMDTNQIEIQPKIYDTNAISTPEPLTFSMHEPITRLNVLAKTLKVTSQLNTLQDDKNFDHASQLFYEFIDALPFPQPVDESSNLWQELGQLNSKEAVAVLTQLCKMHFKYVCGMYFKPKDSFLNPQAVVSQYKLIAIVDSLIRYSRPEDTNLLGIDPLPNYDLLKLILNKNQILTTEKGNIRKYGFHLDYFTGLQIGELNRLYSYFEGRDLQRPNRDQPLAFQNNDLNFGHTPYITFDVRDLASTLKNKLNPEIEFVYNLIQNPEGISFEGRRPLEVRRFIDPDKPLGKAVIEFLINDKNPLKYISPVYHYWRLLNLITKTTFSFPLSDCSSTLDSFEISKAWENQEKLNFVWKYVGNSLETATSFRIFSYPKFIEQVAYPKDISDRYGVIGLDISLNRISLKALRYPYLFSSKPFAFEKEEFLKLQDTILNTTCDKNDALFDNFTHLSENSIFSRQQYKELLILHLNPETAFSDLISFYKRNQGLLADPDNMKFFFNRFFSGIIDGVAENRHLLGIIKDFIKSGLESARLTENPQLTYFYTKLAISFNNFSVGLGRNPQNLLGIDLWKEIKYIKDNILDSKNKNEFYNWGELAEQLIPFDRNEQGKILLLQSWDMSKGNSKTRDSKARNIRTKIYKETVRENPQFFMDSISRFDPALQRDVIQHTEWIQMYPLCVSLDTTLAINCETGSIMAHGHVLSELKPVARAVMPPFLYRNERIQVMNAEKSKFHSETLNCDVYITYVGQGVKISIVGNEHSRYQGIYNLFEISNGLQDSFRILFSMYKNPTIWQVDKQRCVVLDDTGIPVLSFVTSYYNTNFFSTINGSNYKLYNLVEDHEWGKFYKIDPETRIWSNVDGYLHRIEMPRLKLEFSWDEKDEIWMSHQYPGYSMSSSQYVPVLERLKIEPYLVLENIMGNIKVILPVRTDEVRPISSGYVAYEYKTSATQDENTLFGVSLDADIYLSYLGIKSSLPNGYAIAQALLKPQRLLAHPPSEMTASLLLNIMTITNQKMDSDPRSVACRFKSLYIYVLFEKCHKNQLTSFRNIEESIIKMIKRDIDLYIKMQHRLGYYKLKDDEIEEITQHYRDLGYDFESGNLIPVYSFSGEICNRVTFPISYINQQTFSSDLVAEFQKYDPRKNYLELISLTRPGSQMTALFLYFLSNREYFREGTDQNDQLKRVLFLAINDPNEKSKFIRSVLLQICKEYSAYKDILQNIEREISKLPNVSTEVLNNLKNLIGKMIYTTPKSGVEPYEQLNCIKSLNRSLKGRTSNKFQTNLSPSIPVQLIDKKAIETSFMEESHTTFQLERFLEVVPTSIQNEVKQLVTTAVKAKLESLLDPSKQQGLNKKTLARLKKDCDDFYNGKVKESKSDLRIADPRIPELIEELDRVISLRQKYERELKQGILELVRSGEVTVLKKDKYNCYKNADLYPTLSFEDLLMIFGKNQLNEFFQNTKNKNKSVYFNIDVFLNHANQTRKYFRALQSLKELSLIPDTDRVKREELKEKAYQNLLEPYLESKDSSTKVLDYLLDLEARQDQMEFLHKVISENPEGGLLAQAIPGFGKTSVILPLYAALVLNTDKLPLYVVPDELLPWITGQLRKSLGSVFDIYLGSLNESFDFSRYDQENKLLKALSEIKKSKKVLILGVGMLHSLNIQINERCINSVRMRDPTDPEPRNSIQRTHHGNIKFLKGFLLLRKFFKEECLPFGDEAHHLYNILNETNHPFGKPKPMPMEERAALFLVYDVFLNSPAIQSLVRVNFDQDPKDNSAEPFTLELYQNKLKPILVEELLQRLNKADQIEQIKKANLSNYFSSLSEGQKNHLRVFLLGDRNDLSTYGNANSFVTKMMTPQAANFIYLLREEIERLLIMTLGTKWGEGYALKNGNRAIPAKNGEILHQAQFSNPHETGNYTIQGVIRNGVVIADVKKVIEEFRNRIRMEMGASSNLARNLEFSVGYQDFVSLSPKNDQRNIFNLNEEDYQQIRNEINASKSLLLDFVFRHLLSEIKSYPEKVNSNCYSLGHLFPKMRAVSGTISPTSIYPPGFEVLLNKGADGKSLFVLFEQTMQILGNEIKEQNIISLVLNESPQDLLEGVKNLLIQGHPVRLVTDAAGYTNGISINAQAGLWLQQVREVSSDIRALCHHQEGLVVIYDGITEETVSEKQSIASSKETLTILQQPYVTGTDIPQMDNAVEVVTVGITTTYTLLVQAIWRARLIHLNQKLQFIISYDTAIVIRNQMGLEKDAPVLLEHLVMFSLMNEIKIQEEENVVGIKLKMRAYIQNIILDTLTTHVASSVADKFGVVKQEDITDFMHDISNLFKTISSNEARFAYSGEIVKEDTLVVLNSYKEMLLNQYEELLQFVTNPDDFRSGLTPILVKYGAPNREELEKVLNGFIEPDLVSPRIDINPNPTLGTTHVTHLTETQNETVAEKQRSQETTYRSGYANWKTYPCKSIPPQSRQLEDFINSSDEEAVCEMAKKWKNGQKSSIKISVNMAGKNANKPKEEIKATRVSRGGYIPLPFDMFSKPPEHLLLTYDSKSHFWECTILDIEDFAYCEKEFENGFVANKNKSYFLYNLTLGFYNVRPETSQKDFVERDPTAAQLRALVRFYGGRIDYTSIEVKELLKWLDENGKEELLDFFENTIVRHHPKKEDLVRYMRNLAG